MRGGSTVWEDGDLFLLEEYSGFGGPGWYRSVETSYESEVVCVCEATLLVVGAGEVELVGGKEKLPGVFLGVLWDRKSLTELD